MGVGHRQAKHTGSFGGRNPGDGVLNDNTVLRLYPQFPGGKQESGETLQECLERELQEELDIEVRVGRQLTVVKHAYTHFRVTVYAFECEYHSSRDPKSIGVRDWRWTRIEDLDEYALPVVDRKIAAVLRAPWQQSTFDLS